MQKALVSVALMSNQNVSKTTTKTKVTLNQAKDKRCIKSSTVRAPAKDKTPTKITFFHFFPSLNILKTMYITHEAKYHDIFFCDI